MLTWTEEFATGSDLVDTQHRLLIEKINKLEKLLNGPPPPKAEYDELLDFLNLYAVAHFKFEEQCMSSNKCPAHEQNKQAHATFLHAFAILKDRYQTEGSKPELLDSIQRTASEWIKYHILTVDINLRACMNN